MVKTKRNTTAVLIVMILILVSVVFIAPVVQNANKPIPFGQEFKDITDLADRLNTPVEIFEDYLNSIGSDYDSYVKYLNEIQMAPEELTADMRENTGYEFSDYIQVMTLISNKTVPDNALYDKITTGGTSTSETATVDVYMSKTSRKNLEDNNIKMSPTTIGDEETIKLFHLFCLLSYVNGDIPSFISGANGVFGCESVEITNINIYANYGVKKPDNQNKMIEDLFNIEANTNEIYKPIAMPVLTLKYTDQTRNISFGVIEPMGLIFTTKDIDLLKKMNAVEFFDVHVRQLQASDDFLSENTEYESQ